LYLQRYGVTNPFSVNSAQKAQSIAELLLLFRLQFNGVTPGPTAAVQTICPSKANTTVRTGCWW